MGCECLSGSVLARALEFHSHHHHKEGTFPSNRAADEDPVYRIHGTAPLGEATGGDRRGQGRERRARSHGLRNPQQHPRSRKCPVQVPRVKRPGPAPSPRRWAVVAASWPWGEEGSFCQLSRMTAAACRSLWGPGRCQAAPTGVTG